MWCSSVEKLCLTVEQFEALLLMVTPHIQGQYSIYRQPVGLEERLVACLCCVHLFTFPFADHSDCCCLCDWKYVHNCTGDPLPVAEWYAHTDGLKLEPLDQVAFYHYEAKSLQQILRHNRLQN